MDFFIQLVTDPPGWYAAHELLVAQIGVNSLLAISIFIPLFSGQLTLANAGFMAIGAYTTVILNVGYRVPLAVGMAAGALLAALVGLAIGLPVLRLRGIFLAIATLGFGEALLFGVILNLPITGQAQGLKNPNADISDLAPIFAALAVLGYFAWRLTRTRLGQAWAAIREDELAAQSQGINVAAAKMVAFVLGAAVAGLAGGLDSHISFFVDPTVYGTGRAVQILTFAVVGGAGSVLGPIVGAVILTALPEVVRQASGYRDVISGVILILVIVFRPQGVVAGGGLALVRPRWWPDSWRLRRGRAAEEVATPAA